MVLWSLSLRQLSTSLGSFFVRHFSGPRQVAVGLDPRCPPDLRVGPHVWVTSNVISHSSANLASRWVWAWRRRRCPRSTIIVADSRCACHSTMATRCLTPPAVVGIVVGVVGVFSLAFVAPLVRRIHQRVAVARGAVAPGRELAHGVAWSGECLGHGAHRLLCRSRQYPVAMLVVGDDSRHIAARTCRTRFH